jgi:predicted anti-sigma-YlaC factor YlaD
VAKPTNPLCARARPSFSDLLDGEPLPLLKQIEVWGHAHFCPFCRPVYRELGENQNALHSLRQELPEDEGKP